MSTKITTANGVELEVCQLGIDATNPNPTEPSSIWARLTPEQRVALAEALNPASAPFDPGGQWTRDDLPSPADVCWERTAETWKWRPSPTTDHVLDAVVAHLNAHHPKSGMEARLDAEAAGAEMTAAYAARDAAERRCDELRSLIVGQSVNVDVYREKVREAERQRDEADRRTAEAKADRDRWKLHHDRVDGQWAKAEREVTTLRSTGAVSRADIEKAIRGKVWAANRNPNKAGFHRVHVEWATDAVWSLLSGDDPAVHVVRESQIHPLADPEDTRHFYLADGQWEFRDPTESDLDHAWDEVESDLRYLIAVRQVREAEKAVDPVEDAALDAFKAAWHRADEEGDEGNRVRRGIRAARHVLGQEADQ